MGSNEEQYVSGIASSTDLIFWRGVREDSRSIALQRPHSACCRDCLAARAGFAQFGSHLPHGPGTCGFLAWGARGGKSSLILQYPTSKISKVYWRDSVRDSISKCGIGALLCDPALSIYAPEELARCHFVEGLKDSATGDEDLVFPAQGEILQLSSGTTGFKKPIRFSFEALRTHASLYNQVLQLSDEDCIVSWLPLYHDMGFIACLVMPLLLGSVWSLSIR